MKRLLLLYFLLLSTMAAAQQSSEADERIEQCIRKLPPGFVFRCSYQFKPWCYRLISFTTLLSKDMEYVIRIEDYDTLSYPTVIAVLYDAQRNEIGHTASGGIPVDGFRFKCRATGIYHLSFSFKDVRTRYEGVAVLAFKGKYAPGQQFYILRHSAERRSQIQDFYMLLSGLFLDRYF